MTDQTATALRSVLSGESAKLTTTDDPWPQFVRRERSHRRRRRAGVLALAAVLVGGIQLNLVPLPDATPRFTLAAANAGLADGPTRGGLAGDTAWLEQFRNRIADVRDGDGLWRVIHSQIKFVFAGDVATQRLVVAVVPYQLGLLKDSSLVTFTGPAGATAAEMDSRGGSESGDEPATTYIDGTAKSGGFALVVGPAGSTVRISTEFTYTAAGKVDHPMTATMPFDGVGVAQIPPSDLMPGATTEVTAGGVTVYDGPISGGWELSGTAGHTAADPTDAMLTAAARGARGPGLDPSVLRTFVADSLKDAHLAAATTAIKLRWSGTVQGEAAALITLQPEHGGVIAYAMHGNTLERREDMRLLMPAAGADRRPLGWRLANPDHGKTEQVVLVAPQGTAKLTLTVAGSSTTVTLDPTGRGDATVPADGEVTLTAYTAGGAVIGTSPLHVQEKNSGGLPGDGPLTRIDE